MQLTVSHDDWFTSNDITKAYYHQLVRKTGYDVNEYVNIIGESKFDVRCGPILRLLESDSSYRASMMIVTNTEQGSAEQPRVTYQLGPASSSEGGDVNIQEGSFPGKLIYKEGAFQFWRYDIELSLADLEQKCRYYLDAYYAPEYNFYVPSKTQTMNMMFYSCNGFSFRADSSPYQGQLWYDVLKSHTTGPHFHVMIGGGDQIYSDVIKGNVPILQKWLESIDNSDRDEITKKSPDFEKTLAEFYLSHYLNWYGRGFMDGTKDKNTWIKTFPKAMASIPSINIFDDHDIIDGFGSYGDHINGTPMFRAIGRQAYKYYLLFQHQIGPDEFASRNVDKNYVLGVKPGPYMESVSSSIVSRLGKGALIAGLDCRTERTLEQIVYPETYNLVFDRIELELTKDSDIKHLVILLGVPIFYPRLVLLESILNSSVTKHLSRAMKKLNIGAGVIQEFDGSVDIVDDLQDHWCSDNHKAERNVFVARVQKLAAKFGVRATFLGGDVHLAAMGRMRSVPGTKTHAHVTHHHYNTTSEIDPQIDPRLMFNVVSSAIVNLPPPTKVGQMLFNVQKKHVFGEECEENMVPLFKLDVDGAKRVDKHSSEYLNRRNWASLIPIENDERYKSQLGELKYPGPVDKTTRQSLLKHDEETYHYDLPYIVEELGLAATIHVETDGKDLEATTKDFEVVIPSLTVKVDDLEQTKVKYVTK